MVRLGWVAPSGPSGPLQSGPKDPLQSGPKDPLRKSGIEPEAIAWKAIILPLNYSRYKNAV